MLPCGVQSGGTFFAFENAVARGLLARRPVARFARGGLKWPSLRAPFARYFLLSAMRFLAALSMAFCVPLPMPLRTFLSSSLPAVGPGSFS